MEEKQMAELPKAPLRRIFKEAGASRVSEDAILALHDYLINDAEVIARNCVQLAQYNNRQTVQVKDVDAVLTLE
jgi:histone H3/H4